jgi:ABC-type amino acid transport substrate-binding protein
MIDLSYDMDRTVLEMQNPGRATSTIVHREMPASDVLPVVEATQLERIRTRGSLRIGYDPRNLPMSFFNRRDELVGFDVALGEQLAAALGVRAEFVPVNWAELPAQLNNGLIDVMPGIWYRPYWFASLKLSNPYFVGTVGLALRDYRRHDFSNLADIERMEGLKIGVPLDSTQISTSMQRYFGNTDVEFVVVEFWEPFFEGKYPEVDAFLMPAEQASAWTLLYPQYTVVVPQPNPVQLPSAFGVASQGEELRALINEWVIFADTAGLIDEAYTYWVLGKGAEDTSPRWSILRNVIGWGKEADPESGPNSEPNSEP